MPIHHPPEPHLLTLRSEILEIVLLPGKGCDIYSIIDRATGVDVLFKTPWGWRDPVTLPPFGGSHSDWMARYYGGWQVLLPHAGPERVVSGVLHGFHGEASIVPWAVEQAGRDTATFAVELLTAPLGVVRQVRVDGAACLVRETVTNLSPEPVPLSWVHHPAFGPPFASADCRFAFGAQTLITDDSAPGTLLAPNAVMPASSPVDTSGQPVDLGCLPADDERREVFGALTGFDDAWFSLTNARLGFGFRLAWDAGVFPHAWIWQECHASPGFPWYRRAYAVAVEPANVIPGSAPVDGFERGVPRILAPHASLTAELELTRFEAGPHLRPSSAARD